MPLKRILVDAVWYGIEMSAQAQAARGMEPHDPEDASRKALPLAASRSSSSHMVALPAPRGKVLRQGDSAGGDVWDRGDEEHHVVERVRSLDYAEVQAVGVERPLLRQTPTTASMQQEAPRQAAASEAREEPVDEGVMRREQELLMAAVFPVPCAD